MNPGERAAACATRGSGAFSVSVSKTHHRGAACVQATSWILHARAREYYWEGSGQLSIKAFFGGRAHYRVGCGYHAVDESSYLVLNDGQSYSINIQSRQPVESFCLFFEKGFAEDVERTLSQKHEVLLDEPDSVATRSIRFFEKNYAHDRTVSPALFRLRSEYKHYEQGRVIEEFHTIVERLLRVHRRTWGETDRLDSIRLATREELYRRVSRARDYIRAMFAEPVTLAELARIACLSPNHLLRNFRKVFGETPHQFLTEQRLQEAKRLLLTSESSVTEICLACGFESLGSFSSLFRGRYGFAPSHYRRQKSDFREAGSTPGS
jgi:AraC family transcriptional regulator